MAARPRKTRDTVPGPTLVHLTVLVSFNGMIAGDASVTELTPLVQGWADVGLVRLDFMAETELTLEVKDGEDPAGPSEPEPDVPGAGEA